MKKFFTVLLLAVTLIGTAQESTLLRLDYTKGDSYTITMNMTQEMGGAVIMKMTMGMETEITEVNKDTYSSVMKFTKMVMEMNQGGMNITFDSTKSDDELDEMGKMMKAQMGPTLQAVFYAKGNNLGEVLEMRVEPNIPGASDMANQSNNVIFPKKAVRVGDTWAIEKENKGMKMNFIYTVKSIVSSKVVLGVSGKISGLAGGTISGSMDIDKKSGVPLKTAIDMSMSMSGQEMKTSMTGITIKN